MSHPASRVPLLGPRSIRVVLLQPAQSHGEPVVCDLVTTTLDAEDRIPYEALSYTWDPPIDGQSLKDHTITLAEVPHVVKGNLEQALKYLRSGSEIRKLWIDALCINQDDASERTMQVAMMGDVYDRARKTIAWIGEDCGAGHGKAFFTFCHEFSSIQASYHQKYKLGSLASRQAEWDRSRSQRAVNLDDDLPLGIMEFYEGEAFVEAGDHIRQHSPSDGSDDERSLLVKTLKCVLRRRYFSRRWIIQEVTRTREVELQCGNAQVRGPELFAVLEYTYFSSRFSDWTQERDNHTFYHCEGSPLAFQVAGGNVTFRNLIALFYPTHGLHPADDSGSRIAGAAESARAFMALLSMTNGFHCSDDRDVIFSLLGARQAFSSLGIAPDYSKSTASCYTSLARSMINWGMGYDLLCPAATDNGIGYSADFVGPSKDHLYEFSTTGGRLPGLPSWVVDWRLPMDNSSRFTAWNVVQGPQFAISQASVLDDTRLQLCAVHYQDELQELWPRRYEGDRREKFGYLYSSQSLMSPLPSY